MGKYADMKKANRKYRRLTWDDRIRIEILYNIGHTLHFIAKTILPLSVSPKNFPPSKAYRKARSALGSVYGVGMRFSTLKNFL